MAANSITLHLDDYAFLKNAVFRVKNVPLMFLPIFYYPIQEDNRATGFLIPIYGSTTQRGQSITNQFFWAINRSHDATIEHDWFSKTGQQIGGEYRYVLAPGSQGNTRMSFLKGTSCNRHERRRVNESDSRRASVHLVGDMARAASQPAGEGQRELLQQHLDSPALQPGRVPGHEAAAGSSKPDRFLGRVSSVTTDRNDYFSDETSFQTTGSLPECG
jgi:hypothetical protein